MISHHPELHLVSWLHGGVECRRAVDGQLSSLEQTQAIRNNFEASSVCGVHSRCQVQLSHEHVGPRLPRTTTVRTLRDDGHKSREDGHIGNDAW